MIHMLMCSNEFEPVALLAVTGKYLHPGMKPVYRRVTHPELFTAIIDAYGDVVDNLKKHATGWHSEEYLHSIVRAGNPGYGIDDVGEGKSSPGSQLILENFEKEDDRPIWIVVNAGSNTLAQALFDYERTHSELELKRLITKLRVFENGAQDAVAEMRRRARLCVPEPRVGLDQLKVAEILQLAERPLELGDLLLARHDLSQTTSPPGVK